MNYDKYLYEFRFRIAMIYLNQLICYVQLNTANRLFNKMLCSNVKTNITHKIFILTSEQMIQQMVYQNLTRIFLAHPCHKQKLYFSVKNCARNFTIRGMKDFQRGHGIHIHFGMLLNVCVIVKYYLNINLKSHSTNFETLLHILSLIFQKQKSSIVIICKVI